MQVLGCGLECEPWEGHHWILGAAKKEGGNQVQRITEKLKTDMENR